MPMRRRASMALSLVVLVALASLIESCGERVTALGKANLSVQMTMSGNAPDPDGAAVRVDDGTPHAILAGQFLELGEVEVGSHVVALSGLASNCQVMGQNPRIVSVTGGSDRTVAFDVACSTPTGDGTAQWNYLNGVGPYAEGQPASDTVTEGTSLEDRVDGTWSCTSRRVSAEGYPDDYATFNPNAEVIYPGAMLQGATLVDATPEPVVVARAGGTVVINLVNGSSGVYEHVDEVKQSTVVQAINDILAANTGIGAARFTFTSSEVQSREQLALTLGVNVSTLSTDFSSSLAFSQDKSYNRFLVKFTQSYYTVSFDLPLSLSDLFAPSVTAADLARYAGPGNPPTYISSVTYGRTFFLLIESTASVDQMRASIKASYDAAVVDGSISASATYVKDLASVNVKVFALGGDQSLAAANFNGKLSALGQFLTEGADIRTGVPLSYVVRNVLDNTIVNVKVATDYDIKTCVPVIQEQLYSDFESGTEGWVSYDNGSGQVIQPSDCLSNSFGRCVEQGDASSGLMQFRAPPTWRENKSWVPFYGGTISYWVRHRGGSDPVPNNPGVIIVHTSGKQISAVIPVKVEQAAQVGWQQVIYTIGENGTTFNFPDGSSQVVMWQRGDGSVATRDDIEAVLAQVNDFRIVGDLYYNTDYTYLDEIKVTAPDSAVVGGGT
jgi:hypothetical protein